MSHHLRFGPFELDARAGQLRKHGTALRLRGQPVEVLLMLVERPGEVVTREELRERLWPGDTFVDFEHGLNAAVAKLRFALGDSREQPRYIETIPRRGYRFVAAVEAVASPPPGAAPVESAIQTAPTRASLARLWWTIAAVLAIASALAALLWRDGAASPERTMLAVLPFENLSPDGEADYFAEGLTEEMVTMLGQLDPARVGVIARQSSARYGAGDGRVFRMAQELGVDYVVQGSVRSDGRRVRVTAQLVRAADDTHVWSESYDRGVRDFLDVQNDVARAIAARVALILSPGSVKLTVRQHRASPEAYEAYLRGRLLLARRTIDAITTGLEYLRESARRDPAFAAAHAGVAEAYSLLASGRARAPAPAVARAIEAARRALQLDPELAAGHATLAQIHCTYEYDWATAEREFRRAVAINPSAADTRTKFASCLSYMGRFDDAIAEVMEARRLDPVSPGANAQVAVTLYRARRYDEALEILNSLIELDPHYIVAYIDLALVYAAQSRYEEALAALDRAKALDPDWLDPLALSGYVLGRAGRRDEAQQVLETLEERSADGFVEPYLIGLVHLGLGDLESAADCMEASYRERSWMSALFKVNPELDGLRGHPRFDALVGRMRFPE